MYEQMSIFDYIHLKSEEGWIDKCVDEKLGIYRFPEETGEWQQVEVLVKYENIPELIKERWLYKDHTFMSDGPHMGYGGARFLKIIKWRLVS